MRASGGAGGEWNPAGMARNLWRQRELIVQLSRREVAQRYRGTYLGVLWSFLTPLLMLVIYTFVFSVILQAKWNTPHESWTGYSYFALMLFAGLVVFQVFSDTVARAPGLILGVPNYVKKVMFPLEILPIIGLGAALVHAGISLVILLAGITCFAWAAPVHALWLPVALLPLVFLILGLTWFLSSLGVYIRDLEPVVAIVLQMLFFLSPIVYPDTAIPERMQWVLHVNPLASIMYDVRRLVIWDQSIAWAPWARWMVITMVFAWLGYVWFVKTKRGFANVI